MAIRQLPTNFNPNQKSAKPESWQEPTPTVNAPPVKPVPNPLEQAPDKQPDARKMAEYYAYVKNEKARRRELKNR
jgi:hypothetical protein